jgi:hypothetical protein
VAIHHGGAQVTAGDLFKAHWCGVQQRRAIVEVDRPRQGGYRTCGRGRDRRRKGHWTPGLKFRQEYALLHTFSPRFAVAAPNN